MDVDAKGNPVTATLQPTCTGTSVVALVYDKGVMVMSDCVVSYGKSARYWNVSRQYRVNERVLIAFSGDHADFHTLQNIIERQVNKWNSFGQTLTPSALHAYLTSLLYARRCKMNPFWNTLIVAGIEDQDKKRPFLGVVSQKGVAYETTHCATGIAAMLLNQVVETECKEKALSRGRAEEILRKALELTLYHDCLANNNYELGTVDMEAGVSVKPQPPIIGDWSIAETNCQYE